jgi:addiction module HigA family antidote
MAVRKMAPIHPGEVLFKEFLEPLGLSQYRLAKDVSVPPRRINEIVQGKRAISADTALRLARYFRTTDRFWLNLQSRFDLEIERDRLGSRLAREVAVLGQLNVGRLTLHWYEAHGIGKRDLKIKDYLDKP